MSDELTTIAPEALEIIKKATDEAVKKAVEKLIKTSTHELIRIGTEIGTQTALETLKNERHERFKRRYDRRLRNTKLLLREYRNLKTFSENAIYKKSKGSSAIDILEELDSYDNEELFVESIQKSKERTAIILDHIDNMLEIYEIKSSKSRKDSDYRKYKAIYYVYISPEDDAKTVDETAKSLFVTPACIYNDIDDAARFLTSLIFGVDGLKTC